MGEIFRRVLSHILPALCREQNTVGDEVARIDGDLDAMLADAQGAVARARERSPESFEDRRDRRIGDRVSPAECIEFSPYHIEGLQLGNSDIECVRGESAKPEGHDL